MTKKQLFDAIWQLSNVRICSSITSTKTIVSSISKIKRKNVKTSFLNRLIIALFFSFYIFLQIDITIRTQFIKIKIIKIVNLSKISIINNVSFNSQLFYRLQNNRYFKKKNTSNSISSSNSNQKNKSNIKKFDKFDKIKVYLVE